MRCAPLDLGDGKRAVLLIWMNNCSDYWDYTRGGGQNPDPREPRVKPNTQQIELGVV